MKIGIVGAGKLGMPVALAIESKGHEVEVYDINPATSGYLDGTIPYPHQEEGIGELLANNHVKVAENIGELVAGKDIVFCAIQTPHEERFEGTTRLPEDRADFDYTFLKQAVTDIVDASEKTTLAVISTCLPGTYEREIKPLLNDKIDYVYNPLYIAMGTVVMDYLHPEFVLIGQESPEAADKLASFYTTINNKPHVVTDITTAEGIKVSYNTWITAKTVIANAWGEMCHKTGMNFDDMYKAWSLATDRLISPRYMKAGIGDSGGCHPRDNIALSYIAKEVDMSKNVWEDFMSAREDHMEWLGDYAAREAEVEGLPLVLVGKAFKVGTNITTGSAGILCSNILKEKGIDHNHFDEVVDGTPPKLEKAVYLLLLPQEESLGWNYPDGSVIIDVWREMPPKDGIKIIPIGNPNAIQDKRRKS